MANPFTFFFLIFLAFTLTSMTECRSLHPETSPSSLKARLRLEDDGELPNCWDSLIHLQACTGEVISFFIQGETYLGHACCEAIRTIGRKCWPNILDTLGFTTEEGDMLEGYCDHEIEVEPPPETMDTVKVLQH
ncbi:hypothetical protein SLE2022_239720 [Rubroshorea leprosula]